jgi:YidC/Oxa1 family membrane protein insertase
MNIYAFGPIAALLDAAYAVVLSLSDLLQPLAGLNASALAIVLITLLVRSALIPVGLSQARAARMRRRLAPRIAALRAKHGKNPERLQRETMALYAEENSSPFAGCLPLLIQAPILSIIYGLFLVPTINGHSNALLTDTLAGAPLGTSAVTVFGSAVEAVAGGGVLGGDVVAGLVVGGIVLALILGVSLLSRWRALRHAETDAAMTDAGARVAGGTRGPAPLADPAMPAALAALAPVGSAARILSWLPLITVVFAAFVPLAAALYLLVTTSWTLVEREILRRTVR